MPNQSLLYTGRVLACSQLHEMMHIARELCGGQICVTPDAASFDVAGDQAVAGQVLFGQRELGRRGPPQAAGVRARPAELGLRRPSADLSVVRAVAAVRASGRGLPQFRLGRSAGIRAKGGRACPNGSWSKANRRPATAPSANGSRLSRSAEPADSAAATTGAAESADDPACGAQAAASCSA